MPSNVQLISSFACWLLTLNSAFGAPAAVQRQRRQTFDFRSNANGTNNSVDGESTTTSWQGFHFDFNGDTSDVNASTNWDPADRAPIAEADGVHPSIYDGIGFTNENNDSDTAHLYPDYDDDENFLFPGYDHGGNNDDQQICVRDCLISCLVSGTCDEPHCANYSCDSDYWGDTGNVTEEGTTPKSLDEKPDSICSENGALRCIHGVCEGGIGCKCDEGWSELMCNYPCTLKCDRGSCMVKSGSVVSKTPSEITVEDMICNCEFNYRSEGCKERTPDEVAIAEEKGRKLAIILGVCLTVAILTSIILPIVLWRKRVIFVMKVVYFFKMWEDNDGKIYDAYISAGTTGSALKFVRNVLAPKLEQQGFKLFIPSRDQLCGAVISEDIITAIKQSRRTIMVVTPEYLQNDWSGFEVLNAQVEMIKLQQRIIPVILEDISGDTPRMRKSLKYIMDSVKCLKVPGYKSTSSKFQQMSSSKSKKKIYKFWQRLELTMPKKREIVSSCKSNCYIQKDSSEQQSKHDEKYSKSTGLHGSKISTDRDQAYECIDVIPGDFHTKSYDTMVAANINPLSIYQLSSQDQGIDISKYQQCFNFKTAL